MQCWSLLFVLLRSLLCSLENSSCGVYIRCHSLTLATIWRVRIHKQSYTPIKYGTNTLFIEMNTYYIRKIDVRIASRGEIFAIAFVLLCLVICERIDYTIAFCRVFQQINSNPVSLYQIIRSRRDLPTNVALPFMSLTINSKEISFFDFSHEVQRTSGRRLLQCEQTNSYSSQVSELFPRFSIQLSAARL